MLEDEEIPELFRSRAGLERLPDLGGHGAAADPAFGFEQRAGTKQFKGSAPVGREPLLGGDCESLLGAVGNIGTDTAANDLAEDGFEPSATEADGRRKSGGEFPEFLVK